MVKTFVLDTNVLIHDPNSIFNFEENEVVVPIYVIEEVDKLKKEQNQVGVSARQVSRYIDKLREKGTISDWVNLDNGGKFKIELIGDVSILPAGLKKDIMDNRILATAKQVADSFKDKKTIIVTKDINMRIKADSMGLCAEDYSTDSVQISDLYSGIYVKEISDELLDKVKSSGHIRYDEVLDFEPYENQFVTLEGKENKNKKAYTIYKKSKNRLSKIFYGQVTVWGAKARNIEQKYALELLMDKNIKVVSLVGKAGTGKTLLALACGLEQVVEKGDYKKLFVARPIMPMGKDIGYLPGSEKDKLKPWMQPIYDNFEFLTDNKSDNKSEDKTSSKDTEKLVHYLEDRGLLKVEALTYIRGRSIPSGFIIIDEAQNLTPHEIKTIVTRVGENTKIVFTGDPYQIDNPYLDSNSNGLTYLAQKLKDEKISGHVTLVKGERSEVAEITAKLL